MMTRTRTDAFYFTSIKTENNKFKEKKKQQQQQKEWKN